MPKQNSAASKLEKSFVDITSRKHQGDELRELNSRILHQAQVFNITLSTIADFAYIFDRDGRFIYANQPLCDLLEISPEEIVGKNFFDLNYPKDLAARLQDLIQQVFETGEIVKDETPFTSPKGEHGFYEYIFSPVEAADGSIEVVAGSTRNVTVRRAAEEKSRESEKRLRLVMESVVDYAIIIIDLKGRITDWNQGAEQMFGYTEAEAIGESAGIIFTPEDRQNGVPEWEMRTALENGSADDERLHLRRDGTRFYVSGVMARLRDSKVDGFVKIVRDMTEKIKVEKVLRDEEALQKLIGAQEDERKRIARDLHDHLGQQLVVLRLKLEALRKECEDNKLSAKIDEAQLIARQIDSDVDFLAWELRPAALNDLGLPAALKNYIREWTHHAGVTAELHTSGLDNTRLAPAVETNLYRIAQEALNNIYKHAKARRVDVMLEKRGEMVVLIIEDNGIGFDADDKLTRSKGLGLIGIGERAVLVGGTSEIESEKGKGTTIFVRVPVKFPADDGKSLHTSQNRLA